MNNRASNLLIKCLFAVFVVVLLFTTAYTPDTWAEDGFRFAVSPMVQKMVLNPGDLYSGSFEIINPTYGENDIKYKVEVGNFFVDEGYNYVYEEYGSTGEIINWIDIESPTEGKLSPNETAIIRYSVNVPTNAPGGGQYASILVTAEKWDDSDVNGLDGLKSDNSEDIDSSLQEIHSIAYLIFAEVTGDVVRQGEIIDIDVPSFLLSGNITGNSLIKNTGNVHGSASYKLQVFPLFSDEEIYTNEEDPEEHIILPNRTRYEEIPWSKTPDIGIFNVKYTVEFEGATAEVTKMVIKCPIWLIFIILFVIFALIFYFVAKAKARKKAAKRAEKTA